MPRAPRGKRLLAADGTVSVVSKNPNGVGSVYFAAPSVRWDGTPVPGRWRATYVGADRRRHFVSAETRAEARRA